MPPTDNERKRKKVRRKAKPAGPRDAIYQRPTPKPKRVVIRTEVAAGSGYGLKKANRFKKTKVFKRAVTDAKKAAAAQRYDKRLEKATGGRELHHPLSDYERRIRASAVAGPSVTSSRAVAYPVRVGKHKVFGVTLDSQRNQFDLVRRGKTVGHGQYIGGAHHTKGSVQKAQAAVDPIVTPIARDYVEINANAIPSLYHLGKTVATGHPKQAAQMLAEPYKQAFKDPVGSFKEHPLGTALLLAGPKAIAGRGGGRVMRLAPKGSKVQRAASVERVPKTVPGTTLKKERAYSPDVITKAGQVAAERVKARKVKRLEDKAARTPDAEYAHELRLEAQQSSPTRMSSHEVRRRVDARVDANEVLRRQNRAKVLKRVDEALPEKGKEAVPLVAQNITRADAKDLRAYRTEIEQAQPGRPARARQNRQLQRQVKRAEKAPDFKAVEKGARQYQAVVRPLQDKLVDAGLLGKEQADMAPLVPYAVRHMDAKFEKPHYRDASGNRLSNREVRALREEHGDAKVRELVKEIPGRLVVDGEQLTAKQIRAHMQSRGVPEPAYITQAPSARGARNYFVSQHQAPSMRTRQRTGEATRQGTFDAHPDVLREGAARMQGLVDAHEGYSKFVGEFARRDKDRAVETHSSYDQAAEAARDLAEETGMAWRPVRLKPFAGRKEQLESLLDKTHPDNQLAAAEVTKALEDAVEATSGPGPWGIVPEAAADQMSQHVRVLGAGGGGKAAQAVNQAFRKTVLATSPKWLFGNVAEASLRSAVARAGPRSYVTGKRIVKRMEKVDPEAAAELQARALGGGHFAMADRMPARKAEQFEGTRLEPIANGLASFWRTPGPQQVASVWKGWTDFVFHKVNQPLESRFQTAMLGAEARRTLMDGHAVKLGSKAVDEAVDGLRDTNTQARFGEAVDVMYGRYSKFSPAKRRTVALYTPFVAWFLNAVEFTARVLPRDHPVLTSLIVSAHQASEEWRKEHGLDKFMEGAAPGFLQGSIPVGGGKIRASRYTPFGAFSDLPDTAAGLVLPQYSGTLAALNGEDWKGAKLRDAEGNELNDVEKGKAAAVAFLKSTIPLYAQSERVATNDEGPLGGLRQEFDPFKPVAPPKKKVRKRKSGGLDYGGSTGGGLDYGGLSGPGKLDYGSP